MESWMQIVTIIFANFGIIWWFRKESRDDVKEFRRESKDDWRRSQDIMEAIKDEMKDFHERLLNIEINRKK